MRGEGKWVQQAEKGNKKDIPTTSVPLTCSPFRKPATTGPVAAAGHPLSATIGQIATMRSLRSTTPATLSVYPPPEGSSLSVMTLPKKKPTKQAMLEKQTPTSDKTPNTKTTGHSLS